MKKLIKNVLKINIIYLVLGVSTSYAECVHEKVVLGQEISALQKGHKVYIETPDSRYLEASTQKINKNKKYSIQLAPISLQTFQKSATNNLYNRKYLKYYTYARIQSYLTSKSHELKQAGLELKVIGKSVQGRDLYAIKPSTLKKKKTILMFGRHHGDEGTANWIIEGFLDEYLANKNFRDEYQLLLYPMINPDGAEARTRYNANKRDLNRSWDSKIENTFDEAKIIHRDLKVAMSEVQNNIFIALDMHGSVKKDFFYRVKRNYVSTEFYQQQQTFLDELAIYDKWQDGNFILSNGHPKMARIVLINHYKRNALTHETVKNIKRKNSRSRSIKTLKDQGLSLVKSIESIY